MFAFHCRKHTRWVSGFGKINELLFALCKFLAPVINEFQQVSLAPQVSSKFPSVVHYPFILSTKIWITPGVKAQSAELIICWMYPLKWSKTFPKKSYPWYDIKLNLRVRMKFYFWRSGKYGIPPLLLLPGLLYPRLVIPVWDSFMGQIFLKIIHIRPCTIFFKSLKKQ